MRTDLPAERMPTAETHRAQNATECLREVLNAALPDVATASVELEAQRIAARKVDGLIIGTGAADFTTNNTSYTLNHSDGSAFQLFDVPGIEGNEARYADLVKAAVAKAHLVVYVNGTNKKPEKATAEKIRSYLHRGTQVCPIVNVRGNADAYEFDEDRVALADHGNCEMALKQTVEVLRGVLGEKVLMPGCYVQGLLGFSALAMNGGESTIHPSRANDLLIQQRNFLKHFGSPTLMAEFSQLHQIVGLLKKKRATFRHEIVESNKGKLRELLFESEAGLAVARNEHSAFIDSVAPEFTKSRAAVESSLATFDRVLGAGRSNIWSGFFNELSASACDIVKEHFGESDKVTSKINAAFREKQTVAESKLAQLFQDQINQLQESLTQATQRLVEDVRRVNFQQGLNVVQGGVSLRFTSEDLKMGWGLKDWGSVAMSIGSYALTGAGIGSAFPLIGTAIGAAVGAAVGLLVSAAGRFMGKEKRIRKEQLEIQGKIEAVSVNVMANLSAELAKLTGPVHDEVRSAVLGWITQMHDNMARPIEIIDHQIAEMKKIRTNLEAMSYGTLHAI